MTELTIRPDEIRDALEQYVQAYEPEAASREEVGRVTETGDGIARVEGLYGTRAHGGRGEFKSGTAFLPKLGR